MKKVEKTDCYLLYLFCILLIINIYPPLWIISKITPAMYHTFIFAITYFCWRKPKLKIVNIINLKK